MKQSNLYFNILVEVKLSQKWDVNNEVVSKILCDGHTLEVELTDRGLEIKVWWEPKDKYDKRRVLYYKIISHGQLGYLIPEKNDGR